MKLIFYSIILNNHQANVADELWRLLGEDYRFVELEKPNKADGKGGTEDYASRPYLIKAWASAEAWREAMRLSRTAECCVFSGLSALPFAKTRMAEGLLSFDMSERWMKRGWPNVLSPAIRKMVAAYWLGGWRKKPIFKLCNGAFVAGDQHSLNTYKGKCFKWGYFTKVEELDVEASPYVSTPDTMPLMWCSRYLKWKHPELPVLLAKRLKDKGHKFRIDMYGTGEILMKTKELSYALGVNDVVQFMGIMPNEQLLAEMRSHTIFLFTSDRNEGWGAVANESMANGCVPVVSNAIGSAPYLIQNGENGFMFRSAATNTSFRNPDKKALDDLTEKVERLLTNKEMVRQMRRNAVATMRDLWSPRHAAQSLLQLIDDLQHGRETSIKDGPCSRA